MQTKLTETSTELLDALGTTLGPLFEQETIPTCAYHTGGGVMVAAIDLSLDAQLTGRQAWLTREEDWVLGFYDWTEDPEDEGVCVQLMLSSHDADNPARVAETVAGILIRLGVDSLQGQ